MSERESVRLSDFGTFEIGAEECAIMIRGWLLVFSDTGSMRWRHGGEVVQRPLTPAELAEARALRDACWAHGSAYDFAPAQHTIAWWSWAVVIRKCGEVRTFQGDAYYEWAPREPVAGLIFFMRNTITGQPA